MQYIVIQEKIKNYLSNWKYVRSVIRCNTKEVSYYTLLKRNRYLFNLKSSGFILIHSKNYFKKILGYICLGIALFPNGLGFIFYPLSFYLLGINKSSIKDYTEHKIFMIKYKRGLI